MRKIWSLLKRLSSMDMALLVVAVLNTVFAIATSTCGAQEFTAHYIAGAITMMAAIHLQDYL